MSENLYSQKVIDLITISTEYCRCLEQSQGISRDEFVDVMCNILPMIYLKMSMLGDVPEEEGYNDPKVTEEDYNFFRNNVAAIMQEMDDFLEVHVADFKFSEQPILCTVSENLADIYQSLRDLVEIFREGYDEAMQVALHEASTEFRLTWGQALLNALRALHDVRYNVGQSNDYL